MKLYFMRHGMTDWNLEDKIQGQADIPLNDFGKNQAEQASLAISNINFDKCYYSPLIRTKETALRALKGQKNCPLFKYDRVIEISYGVCEGDFIPDIRKNPHHPLHNYLMNPEFFIPPERGESIPGIVKRAQIFLDEIKNEADDNKNILIVSHGGFIRAVIMAVQKLPPQFFRKTREQKNCAVTVFEFKDGKWKLLQDAVNILAGEKLCN